MAQDMQEIEKALWAAADKLRGSMNASDYKYVVLGLIFLKYISDSFEEKYQELIEEGLGLENDRDAYVAENIFYVPKKARWEYLVAHSKDHDIGVIVDEALDLIEKENSILKDVLPRVYNTPDMRSINLGEIIDLFTNIKVGSKRSVESDILGRIYEYFLQKFAENEGKSGGEFYTPECVVKTMVEMIEPYEGRIYDPCCGSGGMFVQSYNFIKEHKGDTRNISIFGQEKNSTTWKLAKMNLAIRSIEGDLGNYAADTFHEDLHPDKKARFALANPPFNISDWGQEKLFDDFRFVYGVPPVGNANFAWIQHMISKLSIDGRLATILSNGSLSSQMANEGVIRQNIIEADLVECIVALPPQLFYTTGIPVSIWFINRKKKRKGKTLFIDARKMGTMVSRKLRELTESDRLKLSTTYHNWQNKENYEDIPGFCKSASLEEIKENEYILTPSRYVGVKNKEDDGIPFEAKIEDIKNKLYTSFNLAQELEEKIVNQLNKL